MSQLMLLTVGLLAQVGLVEKPTLQFTNNTGGSINLLFYDRDNNTWENGKRPLVIRTKATASITLREGNFQVVARNEWGHEDKNNRILAARELDWMDLTPLYGAAEPGKPIPPPMFKIMEHKAQR